MSCQREFNKIYFLLRYNLDIPKIDIGQVQKWKMDYSILEIQQVNG